MKKLAKLYEGKAKKVFKTDQDNLYLVEFKDDATAFNAQKRGTILGKGIVNNKVSVYFFNLLAEQDIPTHLVEYLNEREMLVKAVDIVPVEVVVRNVAAGGLSQRVGLAEGTEMPFPVLEFYYKSDELGDPLINDSHIRALKLASDEEMKQISELALKINTVLKEDLAKRDIVLVDFKLEFGRYQGEIILADEISPDTCRFWDANTQEKLDKDRFRRDLGGVEEAYQEVLNRLMGGNE